MKPLVIYHADCTDGYGAAFAAWLKLGDEAEYLPIQYGANIEFDPRGRDVYVLDFSFTRERMELLFDYAKRVIWLDHHKTAFEMWLPDAPFKKGDKFIDCARPQEKYILLNDNKSGALLAWEYFHPGTEVPMLIQHIDDRDRWQWKLEGSAEIHAALGSMKPWSFEQWNGIFGTFSINSGVCEVIEQGAAILRAQKQHVEQMAKQARECEIVKPGKQRGQRVESPWQHRVSGPNHMGYFDQAFVVGLAVNAPLHQSEVGHELANASGTFGLVWYLGADNKVKCSLRSNGEYDVSAIARAFGGGGHRNAAGFQTDINTLMEWLK